MLSVVIATQESERALLPTLAALVPGAAAGIVREVIIADAGSRDATAEVADAAGCCVLISPGPRGARLRAAAAVARAAWFLFLEPGIVPDATWIDETRQFMEAAELQDRAGSRAAVFRPGVGTSRPLFFEALALDAQRPRRPALRQAGPADRQAALRPRSAATARTPMSPSATSPADSAGAASLMLRSGALAAR